MEGSETSLATDDPVLRQAVERVVRDFAPRRVVLFGSRAAGAARPDSDYDLLVLVDGEPDVRALAGRIRWHLLDLAASFDIVVRPTRWWARWSGVPLTCEHAIERDGRELYAA